MLGRIATYALGDRMIQNALRTQARVADIQAQEASGSVSTDFGGLGRSSRTVLDLQTALAQSKACSEAATKADSKIEVMYAACTQMTDLVTRLRSSIVAATDAGTLDDTTLATLKETVSGYMDEFAAQLNSDYDGDYLFAGARTDTAPVDLSASSWPPQTSPSTASTGYYQGDDQIASVRVSSARVVQYGVTADNPAFEKALRAFNLVANMTTTTASTTLTEAAGLASAAVDAVAAVQTGLSIHAKTLEDSVSMQTAFQDQASTLESNLTGVDVAALAAELSTRQAQLEASYAAIAKIQSLNLVDYLR